MKVCLFAMCIGALAAAPATATQIYRCEHASGPPSYQQVPCRGGGGPVELSPPAARWEGLREGERQLLERYRREDARPAKRRARKARDDRPSERSCWQKRQRLERVSAKLRRGYKPAQGERLRRSRDELYEFIRRYCD